MGFLTFGFPKTLIIIMAFQMFKQKLMDQYIQIWSNLADSFSSETNYRIFKDSYEISKHIKILPNYFTKILFKFTTRNHKLPVEIGR